MLNTIKDLCALPGISGREHAVRDYIIQHLQDAPAVGAIRVDRLGNCIVSLKGRKAAPKTVLFAAHMDEVGVIVTGITEDGYLRFDTVGGMTPDVLFSRTVWVNGRPGVIGGKAVHQCKGEEKTKIPAIRSMLIDIGADSKEEAYAIAREGDAVTFSPASFPLAENKLCAKALDDRAGCALLLQLAHTEPEYDVTLVFTVQEEIGLRGAMTAAFALQPEIAVVVDSTTAADSAGVPSDKQVCRMGDGPVVSFMDRQTMYDPSLYAYIRQLAEQHGIPTQTKSMVAGGNDAGAFQRMGEGAYTAAVSLPCRYIHSPSSVLLEQDITDTYRFLELLLNTLPVWETPL